MTLLTELIYLIVRQPSYMKIYLVFEKYDLKIFFFIVLSYIDFEKAFDSIILLSNINGKCFNSVISMVNVLTQ